MIDSGPDFAKRCTLQQFHKHLNFDCGPRQVYTSQMKRAVVSTSIQPLNICLRKVCDFWLVIKCCLMTFWTTWRLPAVCCSADKFPLWQRCSGLYSHHHSESSQASSSLPVCLPVCLSCARLRPVLVRGAQVGAGLEGLVLRLCPHITTADCSCGWLGFSAKTGITDPCRLPTFTAATSMFSQSELRRPRELKIEVCVSVCFCLRVKTLKRWKLQYLFQQKRKLFYLEVCTWEHIQILEWA